MYGHHFNGIDLSAVLEETAIDAQEQLTGSSESLSLPMANIVGANLYGDDDDERRSVQVRCPMAIVSEIIDGKTIKVIHAYIRGPVDDVCGYVSLIDTLNRADEGIIIKIHIQSGGGLITTGATIASAIAGSRAHVITIAEGLCASAASLIWSAGDECIVTDYAMFMYHMSAHSDSNTNSLQIAESAIKLVKYVTYCLMKNALKKGHITQDQHRLFCENKREVWISASQMRKQMAEAA